MAARNSRNLDGLRRRFAENLVLARNRAELSQTMVAERSGLHVTQISLLERSLRLPRLDTIAKLAGALGITPCELMEGMSWRPPSRRQPGRYAQQGSEGSGGG
jgi:transcriptional regulator with XRE-family HTH domain